MRLNLAYGPENGISLTRPYIDRAFKNVFWRFADKNVFLRPYMDTCFFAQWFYPNMVGTFGILKDGETFGYKENLDYFYKSMRYMAEFYRYCCYDKELFGEAVFLHNATQLDNLDSIGTVGVNMIEAYKICPNSDILCLIEILSNAIKNNVLRFEDGTFRREKTMWADDTYMSCPFLVRLGLLNNDESFFEECVRQLRGLSRGYIWKTKVYILIYTLLKSKSRILCHGAEQMAGYSCIVRCM